MHPAALPTPPIASAPPSACSIEILIGEVVAAIAGTVAVAVRERQFGPASLATKRQAAAFLTQLYLLKQATAGTGEITDFDRTAAHHGRLALRERCGPEIPDVLVAALVDEALALLHRVMKSQLH
jgi:hypothetical protein